MRVAYVCTDPGVPAGGSKGASVHVQAVLRVLVARGAEVHLVAARPGAPLPPDLAAVRVHALPAVRSAGHGSPTDRERAAQSTDAAVADALDRIAADGGLDLVYERYALWGRTATAWAAGARTPCVLEVNAPLVDEQAAHRVLVDRPGADAVARAATSAAAAVVCVSDGVAAWARAVSSRPDRVVVVPNGVDPERVRPAARPAAAADADPFVVGFVGTLKPWHGVELAVAALADLARRHPGYRLLLVGDGPQAGDVRAAAVRLGVADRVEWAGAVAPAAVPALLHRMDVAVAPYPALDGFYFSPLKVYEYLAAGLPVVASRVGQVPDALGGGRVGVLTRPGDPAELADAVDALRLDPARRASLGRAARGAALSRHTWTATVEASLAAAGVALPAGPARARGAA